jgi:hypothetical protein
MERIEQYQNRYAGKTCAILGGSASLPHDLRQIPDVDVLIGVNQHATILPLDFLVFRDAHIYEIVKDLDIKLITQLNKFKQSNIIHAGIGPAIAYSGGFAVWVADYMGFAYTYICGMDQYAQRSDGREYWWQGPQGMIHKHNHCNTAMDAWKMLLGSLQHPERIKFVSGRLQKLRTDDES